MSHQINIISEWKNDFSILPIQMRVKWRDALSRHLLEKMHSIADGEMPSWKIENQISTMNLSISTLINNGIVDTNDLIRKFEVYNNRNDYHAADK